MRRRGGTRVRVCLITAIAALSVFACSRGLPPPEESARAIMRALAARDFSGLAERFSERPLRDLLASGQGEQGLEDFCRRLLPIVPPPASWTLRFARAIYQDDGTQILLRLCLLHGSGEGRRLFEASWRMRYIDGGGWKLVAY